MKAQLLQFFNEGDEKAVTGFFEASDYIMMDASIAKQMIRPRDPAGHKTDFGHLLLIAGSEGKTGAAILSAKAALRTGCGLLTVNIPPDARTPLLIVVPEAMTELRDDALLTLLSRFHAVAFGPGAGMQAGDILLQLLQEWKSPMVIDADGLNLLSQHKNWLKYLSPAVILTPHPGEFDRMTQSHHSRFARLLTQLEFAKQHNVIVLLKGQFTSVATPAGKLYFNTTGNNGMATAGSGDVLTGIIGSLLAQGYMPETAAVLGAYLHGFAGDEAAGQLSKTSVIASDISAHIPAFFRKFEK